MFSDSSYCSLIFLLNVELCFLPLTKHCATPRFLSEYITFLFHFLSSFDVGGEVISKEELRFANTTLNPCLGCPTPSFGHHPPPTFPKLHKAPFLALLTPPPHIIENHSFFGFTARAG